MKEYKRDNPIFSLCGLNCGLCPKYHTDGDSKCPGCGGIDFYLKHPSCKVINCNMKHDKVKFCFQCTEYPCEKYRSVSEKDSFITYTNVLIDFKKAKDNGIDVYMADLEEKIKILNTLLNNYNDGRKKNFYCLAINLLPLDDIKEIMESVLKSDESVFCDQKEKANYVVDLFKEKAREKGIELSLRK